MSHKIGRQTKYFWTPDSVDTAGSSGATFNGYRVRNLGNTGNSTLIMIFDMQAWDGKSDLELHTYYAPDDANLGNAFIETRTFVGPIGTDISTIVPVTNTFTLAMPGVSAAVQKDVRIFSAAGLGGLTDTSLMRIDFERQAGDVLDTYASAVRWFSSIVVFQT